MTLKEHLTQISNVLVIGCGGAGLRSAIEIKKSGLDVCILGKRPKTDAHTVLAAGGINAALGNLDKEDSWEQHFIDTYLEGYGIGDPLKVEIMAKESPSLVKEIDNIPTVESPFNFSDSSMNITNLSPKLGEHTDEILASLKK